MKTWQERLWDWYTNLNGVEVFCEWCCGPMTEETITEGDGLFHCGCYDGDDGDDADYRSEQVLRYAENN